MSLARFLLFSILPVSMFAQTVPLTPEQRGDLYMARKMYRKKPPICIGRTPENPP